VAACTGFLVQGVFDVAEVSSKKTGRNVRFSRTKFFVCQPKDAYQNQIRGTYTRHPMCRPIVQEARPRSSDDTSDEEIGACSHGLRRSKQTMMLATRTDVATRAARCEEAHYSSYRRPPRVVVVGCSIGLRAMLCRCGTNSSPWFRTNHPTNNYTYTTCARAPDYFDNSASSWPRCGILGGKKWFMECVYCSTFARNALTAAIGTRPCALVRIALSLYVPYKMMTTMR